MMAKIIKVISLCLAISTAWAAEDYISRVTATGTFERDEKGLYFQAALATGRIYLKSSEYLENLRHKKQVITMSALMQKTDAGDFYTENYCFTLVK